MDRFRIPFRIRGSGWLLLVLCVFVGIAFCGLRLGPVAGVAVAGSLLLHEVGHILAAIMLRVPVREFGLCLGGAYNRRALACRRRDEILISIAGPLMNLLLVFPLFLYVPVIGNQLAFCNLLLFAGNILPLPSSDGSRILRTLMAAGEAGQMTPAGGEHLNLTAAQNEPLAPAEERSAA